MRRFIPDVFSNPTIRVSMVAILIFGFAGASTGPYASIIGIKEIGLSNVLYSSLIFCAAAVNVTVSILLGNLADRVGGYRRIMMTVCLFGIAGYGSIYFLPSIATFVIGMLLLVPIFNTLNALLFANVRVVTNTMPRHEVSRVNTGVRSMISLAWVLVPGLTGLVLTHSQSRLAAYLFAALACLSCLVLISVYLPNQPKTEDAAANHLSHLAALTTVASPFVAMRIAALAFVTAMLHLNDALLSLIATGQAQGAMTDVGIVIGIVALIEIVFMMIWAQVVRRKGPMVGLMAGGSIYATYLCLLSFAHQPWHLYALSLISGIGAAALISIPITYLQDLLANRPGLGSALISVNIFVSAALSALMFAVGTSLAGYASTALIGAVGGVSGLTALIYLERRPRSLTTDSRAD